MRSRWMTVVLLGALVLAFVIGYRVSSRSGIQPGYFEKAEAPAYGAGEVEVVGGGLDEDLQEHFKELQDLTQE